MSKKGFSYYIRLDKQSFQGQLIRMYLLVAIIVLAIMLLFRHSFYTYRAEKSYIHNTLLPTASRVQNIADIIEITQNPAKNPEREKLNQLIAELNGFAGSWEQESAAIYYRLIIDGIEVVQETALEDKEWKRSKEANKLIKDLSQFQQSLQITAESIDKKEEAKIKKLDFYLFGSFLLFFFAGVTISHFSIKKILLKIKSLRIMMGDISSGHLPETIENTNDEFSTTRNEVSSLSGKLKALTHFAKEVGQGNFEATIDVFEQDSTLGKSLSEMRDSLKKVTDKEIARSWFNEGVAKFAELLRKNNQDIKSLTNEIIGPLVKYMGAVQGAIFIVETDQATHIQYLKMSSCYAYDRLKFLDKKIHAGSGLIGQAFLEKEKIHLTEIPADYESVATGLGSGTPKSIIIIPLLDNGKIEGVLELASMKEIKDYQIQFLEKISETVAITVSSVKNSEKTQELLEEAQLATEQLRAQEEEMRQNMEELQATQEDMERNQLEMSQKEFSLQAFMNNTPDPVVSISSNYKVLMFNTAFKELYNKTAYQELKEGDKILPLFGNSTNKWQAYLQKAFGGVSIHINSIDLGEENHSLKEYFIFPVPSKNGSIESVSILSRDLTKLQHSLNRILNKDN